MKPTPSIDAWLKDAKAQPNAAQVGMYLTHNGVARATPRAQVRGGQGSCPPVTGMEFHYDREKAEEAAREARRMEGIYYVRYWLNEGTLSVGDDLMLVLIGGDIRPRVVACLEQFVGKLKRECITERELTDG